MRENEESNERARLALEEKFNRELSEALVRAGQGGPNGTSGPAPSQGAVRPQQGPFHVPIQDGFPTRNVSNPKSRRSVVLWGVLGLLIG